MNYLVVNAGKCNLLTSSKTAIDIHISDATVSNEKNKKKLLGINLRGRLNFDFHADTLIKKASKRCYALATVSNYMDSNKRHDLMNAFIKPNFSYCPLDWLFHSRYLNNKINRLYKKVLRLSYRNKISLSFEELLKEAETVNIHQRNLQILATEIYKAKK